MCPAHASSSPLVDVAASLWFFWALNASEALCWLIYISVVCLDISLSLSLSLLVFYFCSNLAILSSFFVLFFILLLQLYACYVAIVCRVVCYLFKHAVQFWDYFPNKCNGLSFIIFLSFQLFFIFSLIFVIFLLSFRTVQSGPVILALSRLLCCIHLKRGWNRFRLIRKSILH